MNKLLTFIFLLGLVVQASAQPGHGIPPGPRPLNETVQNILAQQAAHPAAKGTTGRSVRLVARSLHGYSTNSLVDSIHFSYSGNRGSRLNNNNPRKTYYEDAYSPFSYGDYYGPYYEHAGLPNLMYDTMRHFSDIGLFVETRQYNGNTIIQYYDATASSFPARSKMEFTYNHAGQIVAAKRYEDTTASLTGNLVYTDGYNFQYGIHGIELDTISFTLSTPSAIRYSYDSSGRLAAVHSQYYIVPTIEEKTFFSYGANNLLATSLTQRKSGAGFVNTILDSFKYTGTNLTYQSSYTWVPDSNNWENGYVVMNHYTAFNNLDTSYGFRVTDTGLSADRYEVTTYTTDNYFDQKRLYYIANLPVVTTTTFYYEYYIPTGVEPIEKTTELADIYPIPAGNVLYIKPKMQQALTICIYNTSGQLLLQVEHAQAPDYRIPLEELPAGVYVVTIRNNTARQSLQFVKQ